MIMNTSPKALIVLLAGIAPLLASAQSIQNVEPSSNSNGIATSRETTGTAAAAYSSKTVVDPVSATRSKEYGGGAAGQSGAGSRAEFTPTSYSPPVYIIR
jgi:hypothetical protein